MRLGPRPSKCQGQISNVLFSCTELIHRPVKSLFLFLNAACLAEDQQIYNLLAQLTV